MKNLIIVLLWGMGLPFVPAQSNIDLEYGSSKADYQFWELGFNHSFGESWRIGAELQASDYRYRFIDARAVRNGFAGTLRLLFMGKISDSDLLRLDFFIKPGWRRVQTGEEGEQFTENYEFEDATAVTLDPGLLLTFKMGKRWNLHTGVNMHMALQIGPETLLEQYPSSLILAGGSFALGKRWTLFSKNSAGPAAGASGDTEKFFWESSFGVRFNLSPNKSQSLILGF